MNSHLPYNPEVRTVTLSPEERRIMRARIVEEMRARPLPQSFGAADLLRFIRSHRLVMACVCVVIVVIGLFSMIDGAGPNSMLYTTKTTIRDAVTGWFVSSPEGEIELDLGAAEERMQEIEQLATDLGY